MRESSFFKGLPFQFLCLAIAAVVMAMIGPYGTFGELRLGSRLLYWALSMCAGWLIVVPIAAVFDQVEVLHDWPLPGRMALAGLVGGVPMTGVVWLLETLFRRSPPMAALPELFFQVAVLGIVVSVAVGQIVEFRLRSRAGMPEAAAPDPAAQTPVAQPQPAVTAPTAKSSDSALPDAFLRRLPPALGRDLLAVEMEDHYARIHTALGSTLILLRLRDAVAELGEGNGLQVHRSWWVAQGAISRVERDGGRLTLVLRNDLRVPVSKSFRDAAKAFAMPSA